MSAFGYGVSNSEIARELGISRQAVSRHRRRGMPCENIAAAIGWYRCNVDTSRKRRGTFSRLPARCLPMDDYDARAALRFFEGDETPEPDPLKLDTFPPDFWASDPPTQICEILAGGKPKAFKTREDVCAVFSCLDAAKRLHLCLMPAQVAATLPASDRERVEAALCVWVDLFCRHWWGEDYQSQPILSQSVKRLDEFYKPLGK